MCRGDSGQLAGLSPTLTRCIRRHHFFLCKTDTILGNCYKDDASKRASIQYRTWYRVNTAIAVMFIDISTDMQTCALGILV